MRLDIITMISLALVVFLILNIYSFLLFRHDKIKAQRGGWRVSEASLLFASLLGPFGAYAGMSRYHHKTRKLKFKLVPLFMLLWVVGIIALAYLLTK